MDQTQLYIIKQSCLDRATTLHCKNENWSEEQIIRTAEVFVDWVCGEPSGKVNLLPPLPVKPDAEKQWLNFNTPDYNKAMEWIKGQGHDGVVSVRTDGSCEVVTYK